jgi:hypothetical protein
VPSAAAMDGPRCALGAAPGAAEFARSTHETVKAGGARELALIGQSHETVLLPTALPNVRAQMLTH